MRAGDGRDLVVALQAGLPLRERPFAVLAAERGADEDEVLALARAMLADGRARRCGGIFDNRRLGAASCLCALTTGGAAADAAGRIAGRPSVTHLYERDGDPDLWFTVVAAGPGFAAELAAIDAELGRPALRLPARRRFKLGVVVDPERGTVVGGGGDEAGSDAIALGPDERRLVDYLQAGSEPTADLYAATARATGRTAAALLARLRTWRATGALRRVGLVPDHRRMGLRGNLLAAWDLPAARLLEAGRLVAADVRVSHCYARRRLPELPFNLYAMLHAADPAAVRRAAGELTTRLGAPPHRLLPTRREFKKAGARPFAATLGISP